MTPASRQDQSTGTAASGGRRHAARLPVQPIPVPRSQTDAGPDSAARRRATWLELFFDLVFVLAVSQLGAVLRADLSPDGFLRFAVLFVPVCWVWIGYSYYADLFDPGDAPNALPYRLVMLLAMLDSIVLAIALRDATTPGGSARFALVYAALRLLLVALYAYAAWSVPAARDLALRHVVGFGAGAAIWLASLAVPLPARFVVWAIGLAVEIAAPIWAYLTTPVVPAQRSHMPERLGLFTLIVLGEAIVVVGAGVAATEWAWRSMLTAALGFAIAACVWQLYFERFDEDAFSRAAASGSRRVIAIAFVYGYGHFFVYAGITAASVGIELAIGEAGLPALATAGRAALCGGLATTLAGVTAIQIAASPTLPDADRIARLVALALVVAFGLAGAFVAPPLLVGALAVTLAALIGWEAVGAR
jgi:low temperature requirement protein LtrA